MNARASLDTVLPTSNAAASKYDSASGAAPGEVVVIDGAGVRLLESGGGDEVCGGTGTGAAADIEPGGCPGGLFGLLGVKDGTFGTGAAAAVP